MRTRIFTLLALIVFLSPTVVLAHVGHGTFDGHSFWHYLTSPLHLISVMAVLVITVFGVRYFRKRNRQVN